MTDRPVTLPALVAEGALAPPLAGLVWSAAESGMPVVVAGGAPREERVGLLAAVASLRPGVPPWPDELDDPAPSGEAGPGARARRYLLLARDGQAAGATASAGGLDALFSRLEAPPFSLARDELGHLGVVMVLEPAAGDTGEGADPPVRVVAAHWVRPVARDVHGHVQRFPPAVLGTWDAAAGRWEDFSWGVMPDLAARIGRRAGDLERERDDRAAFLLGLATAGVVGVDEVAAAVAGDGRGPFDASRGRA